jgi:lipopolysaccharide/colanic/teichoic acid biosynthesis glycosyltransferase
MHNKKFYRSILKPITEKLLAAVILLLIFPFLLILALLLLFELRSFPFYIQERAIGLGGKKFQIIKLRTMPQNYQAEIDRLSKGDPFLKPELNKFINPVSSFLRRYGIDELPQLVNVLLGQMSFVGPRPLMLSDLEYLAANYPDEYSEREIIKSKPGITGFWQVFGEREKGTKNLIELDSFYERNSSFLLDLVIALNTLPVIFLGLNLDAVTYNNQIVFRSHKKGFRLIGNRLALIINRKM